MAICINRRGFLAGTGALIVLHPYSARAQAGQAHLRIMETTDIHVHVLPYDYYADEAVDTLGLARTASLIEAVRAESTNSLLLDNGDLYQGNPMGDFIAYERGVEGQLHPVTKAMNALGFDASTLGNHEFNYGLDFLAGCLAGAEFPFVSANVVTKAGATPDQDETLVPPYVILDRTLTDGAGEEHPIRIGVIGFAPPQIVEWDRKNLEGRVTARDIVETAEAWVPKMRAEGAQLVVALCHSGIGEAEHVPMQENAAIPLAGVEGIDVVLTGHQHLVFPGEDYAGTPGRGRGPGLHRRQARRHGRVLGQPHGPRGPHAGAGRRRLARGLVRRRGAADLPAGRGRRRSPRPSRATRRSRPPWRPSTRGRWTTSGARWARRRRLSTATSRWWRTTPPCRS